MARDRSFSRVLHCFLNCSTVLTSHRKLGRGYRGTRAEKPHGPLCFPEWAPLLVISLVSAGTNQAISCFSLHNLCCIGRNLRQTGFRGGKATLSIILTPLGSFAARKSWKPDSFACCNNAIQDDQNHINICTATYRSSNQVSGPAESAEVPPFIVLICKSRGDTVTRSRLAEFRSRRAGKSATVLASPHPPASSMGRKQTEK